MRKAKAVPSSEEDVDIEVIGRVVYRRMVTNCSCCVDQLNFVEMIVYADGSKKTVSLWKLVTLDEVRDKKRTGMRSIRYKGKDYFITGI
jgi:hypothetical protein